jgi:hypothetical protein
MKMHDGEAVIDVALVRRLVAAQFPDLTSLPVREVRSTGTVNAIYRLGDRLCARLPRLERYAESLEREWRWLPDLAPGLTLRVPEPVSLGQPFRRKRLVQIDAEDIGEAHHILKDIREFLADTGSEIRIPHDDRGFLIRNPLKQLGQLAHFADQCQPRRGRAADPASQAS